MNQKEEKFYLKNYIPKRVIVGKNNKEEYIEIKETKDNLLFSYVTNGWNNSRRKYSLIINKLISKNKNTFEVLGLLQAEMGKTRDGSISFSNSEYKIINQVIRWFNKEFDIPENKWKWNITINIQEPEDNNYKENIENNLIKHWINKSLVKLDQGYPKKINYRKVKHTKLKNYYYGCLRIEFKDNLFSQIFKNFLKSVMEDMINEDKENIKDFMRGMLAGEGCVECNKKTKKFRVHITAMQDKERNILYSCFNKLNIDCKYYKGYKDLIISKKENLIQLLNQRLMTLHPRKYAKFLNMMKNYPNIKDETDYFKEKGKNIWNKTPQEKINQILEVYKSGITRTKDIAEKVRVSIIKVNRVLKENNLGKRLIRTEEYKREEIAEFAKANENLPFEEIAKHFDIHRNVVQRACRKYNIKRRKGQKYQIPEEKIQKIIELYNRNPAIKFSEISKEVGVSSSVIMRVRKEYNLGHLGYKYLIGCNNPNARSIKKINI